MWIKALTVQEIRCFSGTHELSFSKGVNIFIGKNSSGKSSLLRCLGFIQPSDGNLGAAPSSLIRKGVAAGHIVIKFGAIDRRLDIIDDRYSKPMVTPALRCSMDSGSGVTMQLPTMSGLVTIPTRVVSSKEPDNIFYPYFSKRKTQSFSHAVNLETVNSVGETLVNLYAKVARLSNTENEAHSEFVTSCEKILGHRISVSPSVGGSEAGIWLSQTDSIPLSVMGEGTSNILGLIVNLCVANRHIFLIEEMENDIHPEALKSLLELIAIKSKTNQIFISTHSNIVLRNLGSLPESKVFSFDMSFIRRVPVSVVKDIGSSESARNEVLSALGYEPIDFGLWKGYLLLEESSAEAVINRILIPLIIPGLAGKLRTISANGVTNVEPAYIDFHRLFVFIHTSKVYMDNAWVRVDGDEVGNKVLNKLKEKFDGHHDLFHAYSEPAFENYYPEQFRDEAKLALGMSEKAERREAKKKLCQRVLQWADANPDVAKREFSKSAAEVIADLRTIEAKLK